MKNLLPILVVEDDPDLREAIVDTLEMTDLEVHATEDAESGISMLKSVRYGLVLSDINLPGMDGYAFLDHVAKQNAHMPVILMTAYAEVDKAITAMKNGASHYIIKPFEPDDLLIHIHRYALSNNEEGSSQPIAEDSASQNLFSLSNKVAKSDATVLITGESGTGKEVLARFIHDHSSRSNEPFIAINCAAIPKDIMEATMFGYEKGAFTGAYKSMPGKFEQAQKGTLLLDEVTEMSLELQAKLLRVLQEKEVERLGGSKTIPLDVRIVATSNRDLKETVEKGEFREDLYYRLNVFPLSWLPLRERRDDIVPIAEHIIEKALKCHKGFVRPELTSEAREKLRAYDWPGNVRELDNVLQRALILHGNEQILASDIQFSAEALGALTNEG